MTIALPQLGQFKLLLSGTTLSMEEGSLKFDVGAKVVVLRRGRPWKITSVIHRRVASVVLEGGFEYSILDGRRKNEGPTSLDDSVVPWRQEHEDYLILKAFRERVKSLRFEDRPADELRALVLIAQAFLDVLDIEDTPGTPLE